VVLVGGVFLSRFRIRSSSSVSSNLHILGGIAATALGPFQFIDTLKLRKPVVYRWVGRAYVYSILVGGYNGVDISFVSLCRPLGQYAFAALAVAWLISVVIDAVAIRACRRYRSHVRKTGSEDGQ
jgi:hypothetical protein